MEYLSAIRRMSAYCLCGGFTVSNSASFTIKFKVSSVHVIIISFLDNASNQHVRHTHFHRNAQINVIDYGLHVLDTPFELDRFALIPNRQRTDIKKKAESTAQLVLMGINKSTLLFDRSASSQTRRDADWVHYNG